MRYICTVEVPIKLKKGVLVEFANELEVSLACPVCERDDRTVVMFPDEQKSYCLKTRHPFPGHITSIDSPAPLQVSNRIWNWQHVSIARYHIEFEFKPFHDPEDFLVNIWRRPTWARVNFTITCSCSQTKDESTQTNLSRPFTVTCATCGKPLYREWRTIPRFTGLKKKK